MDKSDKLKQELEELERKSFMLQMIDHWSDEDYRHDRELTQRIREIEEEIKCLNIE